MFEDFYRVSGGDPVGPQKDHDIFDLALLSPRLDNQFHPLFAQFGHLEEPVGIRVDNIQGRRAEMCDNTPGRDRPHPFDQPGSEVSLDPLQVRWVDLLVGLDLELTAVLGVVHPTSLDFNTLPFSEGSHGPHHGGALWLSFQGEPGDGVAIFRIVVGDALYIAAERCCHFARYTRRPGTRGISPNRTTAKPGSLYLFYNVEPELGTQEAQQQPRRTAPQQSPGHNLSGSVRFQLQSGPGHQR